MSLIERKRLKLTLYSDSKQYVQKTPLIFVLLNVRIFSNSDLKRHFIHLLPGARVPSETYAYTGENLGSCIQSNMSKTWQFVVCSLQLQVLLQ